ALERGGVRADFESVDAPTGTVVSVVGENGQRAMLTDRGANSLLSETFVLQSLVAPFDHVHVSGYLFLDASTRRVARAALVCAIESARSVSVDVCSVGPLAQITPEAFLHGAQGATYLFANEEEALALTSRATVGNALDFLADRFDEVMITRGSQGALAARGAERYDVRAHQVRVLDTTGAGDAATGAYLGARLDALSIGSSMDNAMTGAARVVGDLGAN
ncbi:MAG: PfkB family carbohydrate kinase, partial [Acidimicrobiales bacterium]